MERKNTFALRNLILFTFFFFSMCSSMAQLTKDNWLVGGSGSFSFEDQERSALTIKTTFLDLSPNIGYFFVDKFAGGLRLRFQNLRIKNQSNTINTPTLSIGPFVRYYFLSKDNRINILSESSYSYYDDLTSKSTNSTFNLAAGPVLYFNTTVGLEMTANYQHINLERGDGKVRTFFIAISLQIHLEKEK